MPRGIVDADGHFVITGSGNVQDVGGGNGAEAEHGGGACTPRVDVSGIQMCWHCRDTFTVGSASMRRPSRRGRKLAPGAALQ